MLKECDQPGSPNEQGCFGYVMDRARQTKGAGLRTVNNRGRLLRGPAGLKVGDQQRSPDEGGV